MIPTITESIRIIFFKLYFITLGRSLYFTLSLGFTGHNWLYGLQLASWVTTTNELSWALMGSHELS